MKYGVLLLFALASVSQAQITFSVCPDVQASTNRYRQVEAIAIAAVKCPGLEACSHDRETRVFLANHGFAETAVRAYNQHHPLEISPDAVWLTLMQGVALHIRNHPEKLRDRFVTHEGKETVTVRRDDFVKGSFENPWPEVTPVWIKQMEKTLKPGVKENMLPSFSTTGPVESMAFQVTFMSGLENYYAGLMKTMCGIPSITLTGTPDDWRLIRKQAAGFEAYEMGWWTDDLLPILDQFVAASEGRADPDFWNRMIMDTPRSSGGPYLSGWMMKMFPYLGSQPKYEVGAWEAYKQSVAANNSGGFSGDLFEDPFGSDDSPMPEPIGTYNPTNPVVIGETINFMKLSALPNDTAAFPFEWRVLDATYDMNLVAGFFGAEQDPKTGTLSPAIGWAVQNTPDVADFDPFGSMGILFYASGISMKGERVKTVGRDKVIQLVKTGSGGLGSGFSDDPFGDPFAAPAGGDVRGDPFGAPAGGDADDFFKK